ncbi:hypothetical protein C8R47DRAFT_1165002 [Mycena vitilis]|nr:hypothetical protein C8R47DRAFT_1165002 [Mycena vitilis]
MQAFERKTQLSQSHYMAPVRLLLAGMLYQLQLASADHPPQGLARTFVRLVRITEQTHQSSRGMTNQVKRILFRLYNGSGPSRTSCSCGMMSAIGYKCGTVHRWALLVCSCHSHSKK